MVQELLNRGMPLKVIAYAVGYSSLTALSRAFKDLSGTSPREWS